MNKCLKKILVILLVFVCSFLTVYYLGFINNCFDPLNSYGFSKAIMMGQVPYRDFNTVTTPLYAFYQSVFLFIYDDFIMIMISQALLVTISGCLLYRMFGKKCFLLLFVVVLFQYTCVIPTYNFMCFFIIILLIYFEKYYRDKDYLIGIVIALGALSKHTMGLFLVIPSIIFYRKNINKLLRRFVGFLVPCFIFLIYLIVNGAVYDFFNLCLFGLFDFLNDNGVGGGDINIFCIGIAILLLVFSIILLLKNKKDINIYYLILGFLLVIPLFDKSHLSIWVLCFVVMILPYVNKYTNIFVYFSMNLFVFFSLIWTIFWNCTTEFTLSRDLNHFKYYIQTKDTYNNLLVVNDFINSYDDPIVLGYFSMQYAIINDKKLNEFSSLYRGNFGFNGINRLCNEIDGMSEQVFLINIFDYENKVKSSQFPKELAKYVMDNCKFIEEKNGFYFYYKE